MNREYKFLIAKLNTESTPNVNIAGDRNGVSSLDDVDLHVAVVVEARVEELELEGQLFEAPERAFRLEPDGAPLVVAQAAQGRGQRARRNEYGRP